MNKYEDFVISMEPPSLAVLAECVRHTLAEWDVAPTAKAELLNLACEIEARMQHLARERSNSNEDWLS